jgi:glycosyltransferase involved in cell wall biosynthesis
VKKPIVIIPNGIEQSYFQQPSDPVSRGEFRLSDDTVLAIYVGRLSAEKNVLKLLDEFAKAIRLAPQLRLLIIGDGPLRGRLENKAGKLGLTEQVVFTGALLPEKIPNILACADFFVTTSVSEVHPLSVIEAMCCGLPIVAVSSPGIIDVVDNGKSGILTSEEENGLAQAVATLASDPGRMKAMGLIAGKMSRQFEMKNTAEKTLRLYRQLLLKKENGAEFSVIRSEKNTGGYQSRKAARRLSWTTGQERKDAG